MGAGEAPRPTTGVALRPKWIFKLIGIFVFFTLPMFIVSDVKARVIIMLMGRLVICRWYCKHVKEVRPNKDIPFDAATWLLMAWSWLPINTITLGVQAIISVIAVARQAYPSYPELYAAFVDHVEHQDEE